MTEVVWFVREAFNARFRIEPSGCWRWLGHIALNGYGRINMKMAHRFVYERLVGPIPSGLTLDHLCRNRDCVNPDHLEPVTSAVNTMRGDAPPAINARKVICHMGHPLSGDNLYRKPNGRRRCRTCAREYARSKWPEHYARHRAMYIEKNKRTCTHTCQCGHRWIGLRAWKRTCLACREEHHASA